MEGLIELLNNSCLSGKLITSDQVFIKDLLNEKYSSHVDKNEFDHEVNTVIVKELMN